MGRLASSLLWWECRCIVTVVLLWVGRKEIEVEVEVVEARTHKRQARSDVKPKPRVSCCCEGGSERGLLLLLRIVPYKVPI